MHDPFPLILGVTGGIASGKSLASEQLCRLGAWRLDADRAGHEVLTESDVIETLREKWGDAILTEGSARSVDRKKVAKIVFDPSQAGRLELAWLESVTHPRITEKLAGLIAEARAARPGPPALVLDAAVMFRAGWRRFCDWLILVETPRDVRLSRALARGWTAEEFAAREAAQEPVEWKRWQADVMIDNAGDAERTYAQLRAFWTALRLPSYKTD